MNAAPGPAARICHGCGQAVVGDAVRAQGRVWHPAHFRCASCGEAIDDGHYHTVDGATFHVSCYRERIAPRCANCRQPLSHVYMTNDWGERFCESHLDEWPRCTFCGRLAPGDDAATAHPRCRACAAVAIEDPDLAQRLLGTLIGWLRDEGVTLDRPVRFLAQLVERHDLTDPDPDKPDALGRAYTTQRGNEPIRLELMLLRGMPSPMFEGVAVHELGHAWLACRDVVALPPWAEEGFCEWISHRWYTGRGTVEAGNYARRVETNDNPIYGGGFRRLRELEQRLGFDRIIAHLVAHKELPRFAIANLSTSPAGTGR